MLFMIQYSYSYNFSYVGRPEDIILWELINFSLTLQCRNPNYTTAVPACVITLGQQHTTNIIMHVSFAHKWPLMISCTFRQQSGFLAKWSTRYFKLTHWGRDKIDAISQTTHSNALLWMKMLEFLLKCHWGLFLCAQWTIFQHCFR